MFSSLRYDPTLPSVATELAPGVWMWRREHPEWTPDSDYEPEVACYAVRLPSARLLIDPLWADDDADEDWIDDFARGGRVLAAVLKPDHLRDAAEIAHAYGGRGGTHADAAPPLDPSATGSVLPPRGGPAAGARVSGARG